MKLITGYEYVKYLREIITNTYNLDQEIKNILEHELEIQILT